MVKDKGEELKVKNGVKVGSDVCTDIGPLLAFDLEPVLPLANLGNRSNNRVINKRKMAGLRIVKMQLSGEAAVDFSRLGRVLGIMYVRNRLDGNGSRSGGGSGILLRRSGSGPLTGAICSRLGSHIVRCFGGTAQRRAIDRARRRDREFFVEMKLLNIVFGSGGIGLAVLALVLTLLSSAQEKLNLVRGDGVVTDKLVDVAGVTAQVSPGKDLFTTLADLDTEMESLVEEKRLFVALGGKGVNLGVVAFFFGEELSFAFFKGTLDDELVVKVLIRSADANGRVLEDELGVALWGEGADEVELALGKLDEGFLGA